MLHRTLTRSLFLIFAAMLFSACDVTVTPSTEQLAEEAKKSMNESPEFKDKGITVKDFTLTPKEGNQYEGHLTTTEANGEFEYKVDVVYEEGKLSWKIVEKLTQ
ncbi:MAG: hypothetical protein HBSAPP04_03200 [Ignavibacteriaceae bacterium]|nr:MAG: hypothetical protein EDM75_06195 [Chlorobiota bacterium]GJQ31481.1 MAG: hypothetical protein HBSAPP04_03200 [Ignavibacteriaceae bacterium]